MIGPRNKGWLVRLLDWLGGGNLLGASGIGIGSVYCIDRELTPVWRDTSRSHQCLSNPWLIKLIHRREITFVRPIILGRNNLGDLIGGCQIGLANNR